MVIITAEAVDETTIGTVEIHYHLQPDFKSALYVDSDSAAAAESYEVFTVGATAQSFSKIHFGSTLLSILLEHFVWHTCLAWLGLHL